MNDLTKAIAEAREALEAEYDYRVSLERLLAALDAARGEAVAWADDAEIRYSQRYGGSFNAWLTKYPGNDTPLYTAPPAAQARERILLARIAELTTERDDALRKAAAANKFKQIVKKQKQKYIYVTSLAELAGAGNDKAFTCLLPCATVARDPDKNIKDVMDAALAASGGVFGKTADPYTDLERAK